MSEVDSPYLSRVFKRETYYAIVRDCVATIREKFPTATGIGFRGASGAMIGLAVAHEMRLAPMLVRKGEDCHSPKLVEGVTCGDWVFLDDTVSSGRTFEKAVEGVKTHFRAGNCLGAVIYIHFAYRDSCWTHHICLPGECVDLPIYGARSLSGLLGNAPKIEDAPKVTIERGQARINGFNGVCEVF